MGIMKHLACLNSAGAQGHADAIRGPLPKNKQNSEQGYWLLDSLRTTIE